MLKRVSLVVQLDENAGRSQSIQTLETFDVVVKKMMSETTTIAAEAGERSGENSENE
jgi:hypothetical protein